MTQTTKKVKREEVVEGVFIEREVTVGKPKLVFFKANVIMKIPKLGNPKFWHNMQVVPSHTTEGGHEVEEHFMRGIPKPNGRGVRIHYYVDPSLLGKTLVAAVKISKAINPLGEEAFIIDIFPDESSEAKWEMKFPERAGKGKLTIPGTNSAIEFVKYVPYTPKKKD